MSFIFGGTPIRPVRGVLFDMDGLLIDSERLAMLSDQRAFADMGIDMEYAVLLRTLGETTTASNRMFTEMLGAAFDSTRFWSLAQAHFASMVENGDLKAKPGVSELLYTLDMAHIPYALASSSGMRRIRISLAACHLDNRFHAIACGDDDVHSKPAPDIFLLAAQRINRRPEDCLVLEDSINGIRAGANGGMQVCFVPDLLPWNPEWGTFCHHACTSLSDVIQLLQL